MTLSYDKNAAVVVLPAIGGNRLQDKSLQHWLSRSVLRRMAEPRELLQTILDVLGKPYPEEGLAALRMWGQTGDRSGVWIAAADPVYLEPGLDHLRLHALADDLMPAGDLSTVFEHLQKTLAEESAYGFGRIGNCGYVSSTQPMATARSPAYVVNGQLPNDFMPSGDGADDYRSLRSEVEMSLHEHDVNGRRQAQGLPPVNSLWLWGGGLAPEPQTEPLPPLFAGDALLRGYWLSKTGVAEPWPGSIDGCLEESVAGFVAVPAIDADDIEALQRCLCELRAALQSGRLDRLRLFFRDGLEADVISKDNWRFWRSMSPVFG